MNEMWRFNFARNLSRYITSRGCTLSDFADEIGVTTSALSNYVHYRRAPSVSVLIKIADVLGCSLDDLIRF